ncbi:MAG: hypothetical protein DSM106950_12610 [Stigonema ocellatum SAG 48.90 = DSM 106950]|nr:hypothetical protein [Stigonema ocellatum SAG 48.90 = DSM 106950]
MGELAEKLAAKDSTFQRFFLTHAVKTFMKSGDFAEYYKNLTDFDYLEAKIKHRELGVQALITDYDFDESKVATYSDEHSHKVETLKLIQGALRLSAHVIAENKTQLAGQLLGRLLSFPQPEIQALLTQAKQWQDDPWLRPLSPSLTPPGGRLLRTLTGHSDWVRALALTPDGKQVISASSDSTLKVWDLADGKIITSFTSDSSVVCCTVAPDGITITAGDRLGQIHFLQLETLHRRCATGDK